MYIDALLPWYIVYLFSPQSLQLPLQWLHMLKVHNIVECVIVDQCCAIYVVIDSFMMTKLHKDIAMHMMQCVQSEDHTDTSTVKVSNNTGTG